MNLYNTEILISTFLFILYSPNLIFKPVLKNKWANLALCSLFFFLSLYLFDYLFIQTYNKQYSNYFTEEMTNPSSTPLPSTTQSSKTQPSTTRPSTTQPSTTQPSTTQPSTTRPSTTPPVCREGLIIQLLNNILSKDDKTNYYLPEYDSTNCYLNIQRFNDFKKQFNNNNNDNNGPFNHGDDIKRLIDLIDSALKNASYNKNNMTPSDMHDISCTVGEKFNSYMKSILSKMKSNDNKTSGLKAAYDSGGSEVAKNYVNMIIESDYKTKCKQANNNIWQKTDKYHDINQYLDDLTNKQNA
jgi:hypothetical protein